jgi:hypothetical protein
MHAGHIQNATRVLGAPKNWDRERDGFCGALSIRDEKTTAGDTMISAWCPTPEEIARIEQGAPIYVYVVGQVHPPISVGVGPRPGFNG